MTTSITLSTYSYRRNRFVFQSGLSLHVCSLPQRAYDDWCVFLFPYFVCSPFQVVTGEPQHIVFTIPIFEPLPSQYYIKAVSDRWLGAEAVCIINFQNLILPERHPPHTGTHTHTQRLNSISLFLLPPLVFEWGYLMTFFIRAGVDHTLSFGDPTFLMSKHFATAERKKWHSTGSNLGQTQLNMGS